MISTRMRHQPTCPPEASVVRANPQPEGVRVVVFRCTACGAMATSPIRA
jgi:hypothetical protein